MTEGETRAALRAIHRLLVVARGMAYDRSDPAALADILDAAEVLPQSLLRPAEFEDLFRPTLDALAGRFPALRGIHDEFVKAAE
ncbi:MAG TPA: hypothetical protein VM533_08270 [Fimbriiglobus sp.]|nr:hypothetical protein [Fimbriiglobus sp.]